VTYDSPTNADALAREDSGRAVEWLRHRVGEQPTGAIVLGSGWAPLVDRMEVLDRWSYREVPGLPDTTTKGHPGEIVMCRWCGVPCVVFVGRWHAYEGREAGEVALPAAIAAGLGARWTLSTNAAGGLDPEFDVGDLVVVAADLGIWCARSLSGAAATQSASVGGAVYSPHLADGLAEAAREVGVRLHRGVLAMMPGSNYESGAEIRMLRHAGASIVSMSTVPEARAAHLRGLDVAALSCVTNRAPSMLHEPLDHDDVLAALERSRDAAGRLIEAWLASMTRSRYS